MQFISSVQFRIVIFSFLVAACGVKLPPQAPLAVTAQQSEPRPDRLAPHSTPPFSSSAQPPENSSAKNLPVPGRGEDDLDTSPRQPFTPIAPYFPGQTIQRP